MRLPNRQRVNGNRCTRLKVVAVIAFAMLIASGSAEARTYVFTYDQGIKYKPAKLEWGYYPGWPRDVDNRVMDIEWRGWGSSRAIGTGRSFACGKAGCRYLTRVRIVLSNRRSCSGDTYYLRGRATVRGKRISAWFGNGCN